MPMPAFYQRTTAFLIWVMAIRLPDEQPVSHHCDAVKTLGMPSVDNPSVSSDHQSSQQPSQDTILELTSSENCRVSGTGVRGGTEIILHSEYQLRFHPHHERGCTLNNWHRFHQVETPHPTEELGDISRFCRRCKLCHLGPDEWHRSFRDVRSLICPPRKNVYTGVATSRYFSSYRKTSARLTAPLRYFYCTSMDSDLSLRRSVVEVERIDTT